MDGGISWPYPERALCLHHCDKNLFDKPWNCCFHLKAKLQELKTGGKQQNYNAWAHLRLVSSPSIGCFFLKKTPCPKIRVLIPLTVKGWPENHSFILRSSLLSPLPTLPHFSCPAVMWGLLHCPYPKGHIWLWNDSFLRSFPLTGRHSPARLHFQPLLGCWSQSSPKTPTIQERDVQGCLAFLGEKTTKVHSTKDLSTKPFSKQAESWNQQRNVYKIAFMDIAHVVICL